MKPARKTHPHLWGAMTRLSAQGGGGDCFWRAAGFVLDEPAATLCAGIFSGSTPEQIAIEPAARLSPVPFFHAWAEIRGAVVAPTTFERCGNRLVAMNRDTYLAMNGAMDVRRLERPRLLAISREIGLARMLLGRQPRTSEPWGSRLIEELGFAWTLHDDGGLIPVPVGK